MDAVACFVRPGEVALEQIRQIFPDREVVGVYTRRLSMEEEIFTVLPSSSLCRKWYRRMESDVL